MSPEMQVMLKEAADMFVFLALELTVLFLVVSYLVGVLQEYITPEKVRENLSARKGKGYMIAALLGAITPFCSCSTIPFLKGLLQARAGFGPVTVFLFSSPLLNPIVIGLLIVTFGLDVAVFYFSVALITSVVSGYLLERLGFERYVRDEAYQAAVSQSACKAGQTSKETPLNPESSQCGGKKNPDRDIKQVENRWLRIWRTTWKDFLATLPYLLLGITIGSFIYGFVPTELIVDYAGENKWYAIPLAAVIGIPLYIRASAVIPLSAGLVQKGMALGSVMALIIGSAGASLTEVILLKSIFKTQMILAFLGVVLGMAMTAGYLYTLIF
ncbi:MULTISPECIES: permease [Pseudoalteromonas]|uniref:permease n=1 Tax=Pseudoalteromonas TaxID=53246 RepID=UPI001EF62FB2|nr:MULTISPECIES: permease [Pseudoalteromonas]MCG7561376.1 permease [Pseudoalteromonas sp. McH1-42]MEC4087961.1 permease [Pseudoalteromonas rubra]